MTRVRDTRELTMSPALVALLHKTDDNFVPFAFMIPLRTIRVVVDKSFCTFRVERLIFTNKDRMNPQGSWRLVTLHTHQIPGTMMTAAMQAAEETQNDLRVQLQKRS